jgi:hypothetical protein
MFQVLGLYQLRAGCITYLVLLRPYETVPMFQQQGEGREQWLMVVTITGVTCAQALGCLHYAFVHSTNANSASVLCASHCLRHLKYIVVQAQKSFPCKASFGCGNDTGDSQSILILTGSLENR